VTSFKGDPLSYPCKGHVNILLSGHGMGEIVLSLLPCFEEQVDGTGDDEKEAICDDVTT
jgi:hypothetical protein